MVATAGPVPPSAAKLKIMQNYKHLYHTSSSDFMLIMQIMQIIDILCGNYAENYVDNFAEIMRITNIECGNYAEIMRKLCGKLCGNYAEIMRKNYAKIMRKIMRIMRMFVIRIIRIIMHIPLC